MDLSNHVLDWGVHFGTTWRIQRMHMGGEDAASGYHYCSNLLFTSLPPVVEAGNLKAISNPVKCFVVTVFARQEHISETAEHRTTASVWASTQEPAAVPANASWVGLTLLLYIVSVGVTGRALLGVLRLYCHRSLGAERLVMG